MEADKLAGRSGGGDCPAGEGAKIGTECHRYGRNDRKKERVGIEVPIAPHPSSAPLRLCVFADALFTSKLGN